MAVARAAAASQRTPLYRYLGGVNACLLPVPMMNILNGGAHADNSVDPQEFMIAPYGAAKFSEALRMGVEVFHTLKGVLKKRGYSTSVGDEGGFAPNLKSNEEALEVVLEAITKAGYKPGDQIGIALDPAPASSTQDGRSTSSRSPTRASAPPSRWSNSGRTGRRQYPIVSIEDGMAEDDWDGWKLMTERSARRSNSSATICSSPTPRASRKGIERGIANSILIKVNQIGTLTETLDAIQMASEAGYTSMVSHRSGETEDPFIADLAVATSAGQIKTGSASRTDRIAKYNQLLRIEEELGSAAKFPGRKAFRQ